MKLKTQQIDHLYLFTRQHYVEWYDLQSELVDHLANAIETQWQENPKLSFDEALNIEFKKFGVFGFMDVVEEKQKFLDKKYRKLIWSYYKEFFKLPKIILTLFLIYSFYHFVQFFEETKTTLMILTLISMVFLGISVFLTQKSLKESQKRTGRKWLLQNVALESKYFLIGFLPIHLLNIFSGFEFEDKGHWANWHLFLFSAVFVLFGIYIFIQQTYIPNKVSEELAKTYPEYGLTKQH